MKIGIIRETKVPEDYRVALTPNEIVSLQQQFANAEFVVQSSPTRAYSDEEYRSKGVTVRDNIDDCDLLLGIKEAKVETLLPNKHYFFFGHIAKMQPYNKPLLQKMIAQKNPGQVEAELKDIQLVGLAALADIMPMKNENRIFVKNAL